MHDRNTLNNYYTQSKALKNPNFLVKVSSDEPLAPAGCPVSEHRCDFSYVWVDPDGIAAKESVTSCVSSIPGGGHTSETIINEASGESKYLTFEGRSGDEEETPSEYYCPLNATFNGEQTWGVCSDGCFGDSDGMLKVMQLKFGQSGCYDFNNIKDLYF